MNKTNHSIVTIVMTVTVAATLLSPSLTPGTRVKAAATPALSGDAFARQIAGAYLVDVKDLGIHVMLQISADGGTVRISSADAGSGPGTPFASRTPALGNWHRTGDRAIQLVEVGFEFDAKGLPLPLQDSGKAVVDLRFADDWQSASGTVKGFGYAPDANILEDPPARVLDLGRVEARKLR